MARAAQAVQREKFALAMQDSGLVSSAADLIQRVVDNVIPNPAVRKLWGLSDVKMAQLLHGASFLPKGSNSKPLAEASADLIRNTLGWQRLVDVAPGLHLPKDYQHMFVDPAVAGDLTEAFKVLKGEGSAR